MNGIVEPKVRKPRKRSEGYRESQREYLRAYYQAQKSDPVAMAKRHAANSAWKRREPARRMLYNARGRAAKNGVPFTITAGDIVVPAFCPILGIPLVFGDVVHSDNSPSLDRIRPALGYVPGNVQVISNRANRIKSDATPEELRIIATYMERLP